MKKKHGKQLLTGILLTGICMASVMSVNAAVQDFTFHKKSGLTVDTESYVRGLPEMHTVGDVLLRLEDSTDAYIQNADGIRCKDSDLVGTGYRVMKSGASNTGAQIVVPGDVSGDGKVLSADYLLIKRHMNGLQMLLGASYEAADVTGEGNLTSTDYLRIKQYFNGVSFLCDAIPDMPARGEIFLTSPECGITGVEITNEKVNAVMDMTSFTDSAFQPLGGGRDNTYKPRTLRLRWFGRQDSVYVYVATKKDFSDAIRYSTDRSSYLLTNLLSGTTYYWKVISADGSESSDVYTFSTVEDRVRTVVIDGVTNSRDLGLHKSADGTRRIKQGVIYRTASLTNISDSGVETFCKELGIKTEIDLTGGEATSKKLSGIHQNFCSIHWYTDIFKKDPDYTAALRDAMLVFADESNYPIAYHCSAGRDRTGTISCILLGLCDCSQLEIQRDYTLTWLSTFGGGFSVSSMLKDFDSMYHRLRTYKSDALPLSENVSAFLLDIGLTQTDIDHIKANIIEKV